VYLTRRGVLLCKHSFLEIISQNSTKKNPVCLQYHLKFSHCENLISILTIPTFLNGKMRVLGKKKVPQYTGMYSETCLNRTPL
jgi:hypothetical protein